MKEQFEQVLPPLVEQIVNSTHSSKDDPLGSYTGVPTEDPEETPVQDADDL